MRTDLTRREVLATLATGICRGEPSLLASAFAADGALPLREVSIIWALAVNDIEKSVHFYARVFGATVMKEKTNARHYSSWFRTTSPWRLRGRGKLRRRSITSCPGIVNFDLAATKTEAGSNGASSTARLRLLPVSVPTRTARRSSSGPRIRGAA